MGDLVKPLPQKTLYFKCGFQVRIAIYFLLFVGGSYGIAALLLSAAFLRPDPPLFVLYIAGYLPCAPFAVRGYIWFRRGKVGAPDSFTGWPLVVTWIASALILLSAVIYGGLIATNHTQGLAGVPIGMLLVLLVPVSVISFVYVECRDWYSFWNERRLSKVNQVT